MKRFILKRYGNLFSFKKKKKGKKKYLHSVRILFEDGRYERRVFARRGDYKADFDAINKKKWLRN